MAFHSRKAFRNNRIGQKETVEGGSCNCQPLKKIYIFLFKELYTTQTATYQIFRLLIAGRCIVSAEAGVDEIPHGVGNNDLERHSGT